MIRIAGLTKRYGRRTVLRDVDLDVAPGAAVALWGPNGAGKTTVVLSVLGFVAYRGSITVDGHDARRDGKAVRSLIGYVPQAPTFFDDLTVVQSLTLSAELRRLRGDHIEKAMEAVEISSQGNVRVGALSGGIRQRLALATALLGDPPVLILDEPTSNLDAESRESATGLLQRLHDRGRTMVVTSHHFEEVAMLVDRVVIMEEGAVVGESTPADLATHLGLRSRLHLMLDPAATTDALTALGHLGLAARLNGQGVVVDVLPAEKGRAIAALVAGGIEIRDVEVWR